MNHLSRAACALLFLVVPKPCLACSCEWPPGTPAKELASHDAVLAGRVVDIVEPADYTLSDYLQITFAVSSVYKGQAQQMVAISTAADGAQCGYPFELGEQYLVYGCSSEDGLHAGLCSLRNNLLEAAPRTSSSSATRWPPGQSTHQTTPARFRKSWTDGMRTPKRSPSTGPCSSSNPTARAWRTGPKQVLPLWPNSPSPRTVPSFLRMTHETRCCSAPCDPHTASRGTIGGPRI